MTDKKKTTELTDKDLDDVSGGILIGLLLPAVQKVSSAAAITPGAGLKLKSSPDQIRARATNVRGRI